VASESTLSRVVEIGVDYAQGTPFGEPQPVASGEGVKMMPC